MISTFKFGAIKMIKRLLIVLLCSIGIVNADVLRTFPNNTVFGTLQAYEPPYIKLEEIPNGMLGKSLGMFLLDDKIITLSPATIIRDQQNNNHVQVFLNNFYKQPVAIQPDFQNRAWVIWALTPQEVEWVKEHNLNHWK